MFSFVIFILFSINEIPFKKYPVFFGALPIKYVCVPKPPDLYAIYTCHRQLRKKLSCHTSHVSLFEWVSLTSVVTFSSSNLLINHFII